MIQRVCVFCGSSPGAKNEYRENAVELGHLLAESRIGLICGGTSVGIMGVLADAVLAAGGESNRDHPAGVVRSRSGTRQPFRVARG